MCLCAACVWVCVIISIRKTESTKDRAYIKWCGITKHDKHTKSSTSRPNDWTQILCVRFFYILFLFSSSMFHFYLALSLCVCLRIDDNDKVCFFLYEAIKLNWERLYIMLLVCLAIFFSSFIYFVFCFLSFFLFLSLQLSCSHRVLVTHCWLYFDVLKKKKQVKAIHTYGFERTHMHAQRNSQWNF